MIRKALRIARESGLTALGKRLVALGYRRVVRPWLPPKDPIHFAGILVGHNRKMGDRLVPWLGLPPPVEDQPGYESALVAGIEAHANPGDRVVVVGGGLGVTATIAALRVGRSGSVHCFEGAGEKVARIRATARMNGVSKWLTVHHAVVGRAVSVRGKAPVGRLMAPGELPECDLLELDCEGAEIDILPEMTIRPRVILVETHGRFGAPTRLVSTLLRRLGYVVNDRGVAEPRHRTFCETHDIHVLEGIRAEKGAA